MYRVGRSPLRPRCRAPRRSSRPRCVCNQQTRKPQPGAAKREETPEHRLNQSSICYSHPAKFTLLYSGPWMILGYFWVALLP